MRTITVDASKHQRRIAIDGRTLKATWQADMADDLKEFHGVEMGDVVIEVLLQEINFELHANNEDSLSGEETEHFTAVLAEHLN